MAAQSNDARNKLLNIVFTEPSCEDRERIESDAGQVEHVWLTSRPPASIIYEGGNPLVSARKIQMIRGIMDCWREHEQEQPPPPPPKRIELKKCNFKEEASYCTRGNCPNL